MPDGMGIPSLAPLTYRGEAMQTFTPLRSSTKATAQKNGHLADAPQPHACYVTSVTLRGGGLTPFFLRPKRKVQKMDALLFFVLAVGAACLVGGLVVLAVFLVTGGRGLRTPTAQQLGQRLENVGAMSGAQFELFVADLFRAMGHNARLLGGTGDQGVDVIVAYQGERVAVQCKNYGKAVGNKPVQEVYAGSRYHGCNSAWVVAPSGFTKGAVELARRVGVSLYDAQAIRTWIRRVDERERDRGKKKPAPRMRRIVDLDAASTARKEDTALESGMEKHTIYVGMYNPGETVAFTAKLLGTAPVNGGKGAERGADCS